MAGEDDPQAVRDRALTFISQHHVVTLATSGPEGLWAAAVFYAHQLFDLYFLSSDSTRHAKNLSSSPQVAATIQDDYDDWPGIQGIQLEGTVDQLAGADLEMARNLFQERFPFLNNAPDPILSALTRVSWYRLRPEKMYLVDNTQGFGHRDEVPLKGAVKG